MISQKFLGEWGWGAQTRPGANSAQTIPIPTPIPRQLFTIQFNSIPTILQAIPIPNPIPSKQFQFHLSCSSLTPTWQVISSEASSAHFSFLIKDTSLSYKNTYMHFCNIFVNKLKYEDYWYISNYLVLAQNPQHAQGPMGCQTFWGSKVGFKGLWYKKIL